MRVTILGVSGSPRKGSTRFLVQEALRAASERPEVETDFIDLKNKKINFCIQCNLCLKERNNRCPTFDDEMNGLYDRVLDADGIILGSPVYNMNPTALMQAFINRLRPIAPHISTGHWAVRVGGSIAVGGMRNGGQETTLESLNNVLLSYGLVVVSGGIFAYNGGAAWSNDQGAAGAENDQTGRETVRVIGRRVAVTAFLLKSGYESIEPVPGAGRLVGFADEGELEEHLNKFRNR